ncbi:hypothetical protein Poly30_52200 [Planctomycetes bacterium Poly30]|uniref:Peptidase M20 dimerisation domain-containing protein n=1 Tax=Saltatorellus ferox TaxID=2528018 RepID=A0A518EZZ5_9BACT|nr:hypothetical protein Poly30_52200 [Planctomycetes bacterium Poly30]
MPCLSLWVLARVAARAERRAINACSRPSASFRHPAWNSYPLAALTEALTNDAPSHAKVTFENVDGATGWNAPPFAPWLDAAIQESSEAFFGKPAVSLGEGGTIPLMGLLGESFPEAQFVITGVLGPGSNAHGPNEFLHLEMAERLTACVAWIVAKM